jgi:hypothetical protein
LLEAAANQSDALVRSLESSPNIDKTRNRDFVTLRHDHIPVSLPGVSACKRQQLKSSASCARASVDVPPSFPLPSPGLGDFHSNMLDLTGQLAFQQSHQDLSFDPIPLQVRLFLGFSQSRLARSLSNSPAVLLGPVRLVLYSPYDGLTSNLRAHHSLCYRRFPPGTLECFLVIDKRASPSEVRG